MKRFIVVKLLLISKMIFCPGEINEDEEIAKLLFPKLTDVEKRKQLQERKQYNLEQIKKYKEERAKEKQEAAKGIQQPRIRQVRIIENPDAQMVQSEIDEDEKVAIQMLTEKELSQLSALPPEISPEIISRVVVGNRLEKLLDRPYLLNKLSKEQIQAIRPEELLSRLDENNLKEIFKFPNLLDKFSESQIQVIDPELLSKALTTYDLEVILRKSPEVLEKLSKEQIQAIKPEVISRVFEGTYGKKLLGIIIDELSEKQVQVIPISFFKNLSYKEIFQLLTQHEFLKKLQPMQIHAINSDILSKALYYKLSEPLRRQFIRKLSIEQIKTLWKDHVTATFGNWFTKFKENFTPKAWEYMQYIDDTYNEKSQRKESVSIQDFSGEQLNPF